MKTRLFLWITALALLSGCGSSNFYQLHPKSVQNTGTRAHKSTAIIGIAEVEVADYLTKSEVVTRMSAGRIHVHEKDVWAGSLSKNIQSVLQQNLSSLLPSRTFLSSPWEEPINDRYRIYVTIDRFDGYENGKVILQGRWSLVNKEENTVAYSESINYTSQGGKTVDEIVETQSRLLDRLSRRIAGKIRARL